LRGRVLEKYKKRNAFNMVKLFKFCFKMYHFYLLSMIYFNNVNKYRDKVRKYFTICQLTSHFHVVKTTYFQIWFSTKISRVEIDL